MPTVPTEQNRVGIAGLTGEKLQPGDFSGTGLQALGTGLETLGATGRKVAVEQQARQDADDDYAIKAAWNDYAEQARTIRAAPPPDLDPEDAFNVTAQAYTDALGLARGRLKNERQQNGFAHAIGPRFDADISSARAAADLGLAAGRAEQDNLIQRNARQDAIDHFRQPEIFAKYLETGAEAERLRSMRRGDDPTVTAALETAYRSSVHRGVIEALEQDPIAATTYYLRERAGMTERDRAAMDSSLKESLAQTLAARDVDGFLPARAPGEADAPLTPEERAAAAQKIEAADWGEARKSHAREDLTRRGLGENQRRKQTASAAKGAALDAIEPLGLDFKSLTQLPGGIRRDLDEDTAAALARQAAHNLDPAPVAPGGRTSLVMNLMATQNPEAFAREDLRLVQDLLTPEEYARFGRLQQGINTSPSSAGSLIQRRLLDGVEPYRPDWGTVGAANLRPAAYATLETSGEDDGQTAQAPPAQTAGQTSAPIEAGQPTPANNIASANRNPPRNISGPSSAVLPIPLMSDPDLLGLVADSGSLDLSSLERKYEHGRQDLGGAQKKLRKAIDEKERPATLENIRGEIARKRLKVEAAARALAPAAQAQKALEAYFVGKSVNIVLGAPVNDRNRTVFDRRGGIELARGATLSTYQIRGPDHHFTTPDEAAFDAIALARAVTGALDDGNEKTGYIVQRSDGTFGYGYPYQLVGMNLSIPRTSSAGWDLKAAIDWPPPEGAVAMWHIHPVGGEGDNAANIYFGQEDVIAPRTAVNEIAMRINKAPNGPLPAFDAYLGGSDGAVRAVRNIQSYPETYDGRNLRSDKYTLVGPGFFKLR
ncbi:hypothetical protein [Sphingomonas sp. ZT3P38]|uniref:hypothetical protein n=1 Tax=Parasphingomonas zepuensis TaxID=3096161 RepID=UPI002FCA0139